MKTLLTALFVALGISCFAQKHEYGMGGGTMNYLGDLAPGISSKTFKPTFNAYYRDNLNGFFAVRYSLTYGTVGGADQNFSFNRRRNLSFYSDVYEFSGIGEINFVKFGYDRFSNPATFFFGLGLSAFRFEPKADFRGGEVRLREYGTEGQFMRHSRTYMPLALAVPFGVGFKLHLSEKWIFAAETFWRRTNTDYLDDVGNGRYVSDDQGVKRYTGFPDKYDMSKFNQLPAADRNLTTAQNRQLSIDLSDRSAEGITDPAIGYGGKQRGNPLNKDWFFTIGGTLSYRIIKVTCNKGSF